MSSEDEQAYYLNKPTHPQLLYHHLIRALLQINIIPLPVTKNRKIKKPTVKLNFRQYNEMMNKTSLTTFSM